MHSVLYDSDHHTLQAWEAGVLLFEHSPVSPAEAVQFAAQTRRDGLRAAKRK